MIIVSYCAQLVMKGKHDKSLYLCSALKELQKEIKLKYCYVVVGLSEEQIVRKTVNFPVSLRSTDLDWQIKDSINEYFPQIQEKLNIDFIRKSKKEEGETVEVEIFAARKREVDEKIKLVEKQGLIIAAIEPELQAFTRVALFAQQERKNNEVIAYVHLGVTDVKLVILQENNLIFSHSCANLTMCQNLLTVYLIVIEQCLSLYCQTPLPQEIQTIIISGSFTELKVVADTLRNQLNTNVDYLSLSQLKNSKKLSSNYNLHDFIIPLGLALRNIVIPG